MGLRDKLACILLLLAITAAQICFSCSSGPADCSCVPEGCAHKGLFLAAPCGFQAVTTSCANTAVQLECDPSCTDERLAEVDVSAGGDQRCTVSVTLGDGTEHDVALTVVGDNFACPAEVMASVSDFTSATCALANDAGVGDGGLANDAGASDAAEEPAVSVDP
jgi:hypothetical protein